MLEAREQVQAVVSDVVMPKMSGLRFFAELRARYPHIPCLLMTGYSAESVQEEGLDHALLRKPFSWRELLAALASLLDRRSHSADEPSGEHPRVRAH
jgi:DNA-binding response OmpR family regulator